MKYILVYNILEWPDMGGGIQIEFPESEKATHKRVEELFGQYKDQVNIEVAGILQVEFEYEPVVYATKFKVKHK